jgi:hypothetical protein
VDNRRDRSAMILCGVVKGLIKTAAMTKKKNDDDYDDSSLSDNDSTTTNTAVDHPRDDEDNEDVR